jgi:hypothetical protein
VKIACPAFLSGRAKNPVQILNIFLSRSLKELHLQVCKKSEEQNSNKEVVSIRQMEKQKTILAKIP